MYDIIGTPPGDYDVEGAAAVTDLELTNENVIILQDVDADTQDLTLIAETITTCMRDLRVTAANIKNLTVVTESIAVSSRLHTVSLARSCRELYQGRYGTGPVLAVETIHYAGGVIAVEEEVSQQRGLFRRILDKIVAAFKWLWEKIAGLFASGAEPEEVEKKTGKVLENIKKAEDDGVDVKKAEIDVFDVRRSFGYLGSTITPNVFIAHSQLMVTRLNELRSTGEVLDKVFQLLVSTIERPDADKEAFLKAGEMATELIATTVHHYRTGSKENVKQVNGDLDFVSSHEKTNVFYLSDFIEAKQLVVSEAEVEIDHSAYRAAFGGPTSNHENVAVELPNQSQMSAMRDHLITLAQANLKVRNIFIKIAKENVKRTERMSASLDRITQGADEDLTKAARFLNETASSVGSLFASTARAVGSVEHSINKQRKFMTDVSTAVTKLWQEVKASA